MRALPAKVLEWIEKALQDNLRKEQLLIPWKGDGHGRQGALDGILAEVST